MGIHLLSVREKLRHEYVKAWYLRYHNVSAEEQRGMFDRLVRMKCRGNDFDFSDLIGAIKKAGVK